MKKTICIILVAASLFLAITSCKLTETQPRPIPSVIFPLATSEEDDIIEEVSYEERFSSVEELYQYLRGLSEQELEVIRKREDDVIDGMEIKTYISGTEIENGIFGDFRKRLLESETLMFPFYRGAQMPLSDNNFYNCLELHPVKISPKPYIAYYGPIDYISVDIYMEYYDPTLIEEANAKGASWLKSVISPEIANAGNFQEHNKEWIERVKETGITLLKEESEKERAARFERVMDIQKRMVYEKIYQLGDRDVMAMVIDDSNRGSSYLLVFFVYDDILVCLTGSPGAIEAALPHLTFREIHMPTGEPVRDTPGRDWSEGGVDEE